MKLRKYRYGSSLRLEKPSFENMMATSSLMRQKHDAYNQAFLDAERGLDFEYAAVDEPYVQEALQPLQQGLDNLSTNLATKGIKGVSEKDLLNYRRQYQKSMGPNGVLGKTMQNKAAMQQTLAEFDRVHAKDPEWYRQKAKQQMLAAYKGVKDPTTGKLQDFTPGPVTGYRDIAGDAIEMLKNAGASDQDLALFRSGHASIQSVPLPNGAQMLKIVEQTPGNIRSNKQNLEAGLNQLLAEYTDVNTDRGRFAQIAEYSPEYIAGSLSNIGNMMQSSVMSRQPGWNAGFQQMPDAPQQQKSSLPPWMSAPFNFPQVNTTGELEENNKPLIKEADRLKELAKNINKSISEEDLSLDKVNPELVSSIQQKYNISDEDLASFNKRFPTLNTAEALNALLGQRRIYEPELTQKVNKEAVINKRNTDIEEAKRNYSNFYSEGMSDEEFLNNVSKELNDRAKVTDKLFSMNITGYDDLSRLSLKSDKQFTKKGSNKTYSLGDIYKQFQDEKTTHLYSKESPMFDDDLNIVIQGAKNDELYVMKPSEGVHKYYADNNKFLRGLENDDNITPEEMNQFKNVVLDLPNNVKATFDFTKPEGKSLQKEVIMYYPDSTTPEGYKAIKMPLKQFIEVTYKNAAQTAIFAQQTTPNE